MTERTDAAASAAWYSDPSAVSEPGIPFFMNVTLTIRPERRESFLAALREVLAAARAEPTCMYLHAGESVTEPGVFILTEGWSDLVEYRDVILRKPYFQAYLRISEDAYAQPRVVRPLMPVQ
jgi:quinol monooxygenase YgiN